MIKKIILILIILISIPSYATTENTTLDEIADIISSEFDFNDLSENIKDNDFYQITGYFSIKDMFYDIVQGNFKFDLKELFVNIISALKDNLSDCIYITLSVLSISIIHSLIDNFGSSYLENNVKKITFSAVYISLITILTSFTFDAISSSIEIINNTVSFLNKFTPTLFLLITTTGGVMTTSVIYPVMLFYTSMINSLICNLIIPVSACGFILSLYSKIITTVNFSYFVNFIRKFTYFILGGSFTLFGIIVSFEGIVFTSVDSASVNTIKYTVSSLVPVIGKFIADSTDVIGGFMNIIKGSLGFVGVLCIMTITTIPILKILAVYISVRVSSIVIQPFADIRISGALNDTAQHLFFVCICTIFVAIMMIIIIGLLLLFSKNILRAL